MASTFTPNLNLELQGVGDNVGTWGTVLNTAALAVVDQVLGGVQTLSLSNVNVNVSTSQSQNNFIKLTGTLTGNVQITFPAIGRTYWVQNATTGSFSVTLARSGGGSTVVIPQGYRGLFALTSDGVIDLFVAALTSGTISGVAISGSSIITSRVRPRVLSIVSSATPTVNTDDYDAVDITALAAAVTSMSSGLSGTPTNFQKLTYRFKDNGVARAISWGASFSAAGVALPTTTVANKLLTVGFIYNTTTATWGCVASAQEA